MWGILVLGLFADGTYGHGWNDTPGIATGVTGLFYGSPSQSAGPMCRHCG